MSGFEVHPEHLRRSGSKLGDFGEKVSQGGQKMESAGQRLTSHASADKSGFGSVISKAFGKGMQVAGKVFDEGGRVVGTAGQRLHTAAGLYEGADEHGSGLLKKIHGKEQAPHVGSRGGSRGGRGSGRGRGSRGGKPNIRGLNTNPKHNGKPTASLPNCGDPIDVGAGRVMITQTDVDLPGTLPLLLSRTHLSSHRAGRLFGTSWASTLDQRVEVDELGVSFAAEDGMLLSYPTPHDEPVLPEHGPRWPLIRTPDGGFAIKVPELGHTRYFAPLSEDTMPIGAIVTGVGQRVEFGYDEEGTLVEIRHHGDHVIGVDTENGLVTALRLVGAEGTADVLLVSYRYDEAGRLTEVINSSGRPMLFDYDVDGRVTRWQDRNGMWYRYSFDGEGRCVSAEGADGYMNYTLEYGDRLTKATNSLGETTTYHLDDALRVVREVDPAGNATESEWDGDGRPLSVTDPLGRTESCVYDEAGDLTTVTAPDGTQTIIQYDGEHRPTVTVDPDGAVWRQEYGEHGELVATTDPAGARTVYGYDEIWNLTSVTDALGNATHIERDAIGMPIAVTDPLGATTKYSYDRLGRVATIIDPLGGVARFSWTVEGLPLSRTLPDGTVERWSYDGEDNVREQVDPTGRVARNEIGAFDLPVAHIGPDGTRLEFVHDTELRLTRVTNQLGLVWHYAYDAAGNLVRETDFDGRVIAYTYDAAGQLVARTNGAGEMITFTRDALGQVVEQRAGSTVTRFAYDPVGRVVRAVNPDAELVYQYDALGRVVAETCNGRTVASAYDPLGRRIGRRTPSGADSGWTYDANGAPLTLRTGSRTLAFGYDVAGHEVRRQLGAVTLNQAWDPNHRLLSQTLVGPAATLLQHRTYRHRQDGVLTGIEDVLAGPRAFDLDPAGRVTGVRGAHSAERYNYDAAGNVTDATWSTPDADVLGVREFTGTQLRRAGNIRFQYDGQGRITLRQRIRLSAKPENWRFSWNAEDRLVGVTTPTGQRWRYRYDAMGRRIAKQRLGGDGATVLEQVDFTWDGLALAEQHHTDETGHARLTVWDFEPGELRPVSQTERVSLRDAPQHVVDERFYAIVTDLIGTPTEMVDAEGRLAWRAERTLWGSALAAAVGGPSTPLRFPGQYHDAETGLHYNYHRYYDATTGSYASNDPLGLDGGDNPRAYVPNPTVWIDPLGLMSCRSGAGGTGSSGGGGRGRGGRGGRGGGRGGGSGAGGGGTGAGAAGPPPRRLRPHEVNPLPTTPSGGPPPTPHNPNGRLYHYTTEGGMNAIVGSQQIFSSPWRHGDPISGHARYGSGGYLTDIPPGHLSQQELSQQLVLNPNTGHRFTHYVEIDPSRLPPGHLAQSVQRPDVYVAHPTHLRDPNPPHVDLTGAITDHGPAHTPSPTNVAPPPPPSPPATP